MPHKYLPDGKLLHEHVTNIDYSNKYVSYVQDINDVPLNILQSIEHNLNHNETDIKVSVYCTSKREYLWKWLYETLCSNTLKFELVVVGPIYPTFELPTNFKFIHSARKPAQCLQIAVENCSGETIQCLADDCQSSPKLLDNLYSKYKEIDNYKCTIVPNFLWKLPEDLSINGITKYSNSIDIYTNNVMRMVVEVNDSPVAHAGGLMSKQFFTELGGFDNKFIIRYMDLDLQMRAHNAGGIVELYQNGWILERYDMCKNDRGNAIFNDYDLFKKIWFKDSILSIENMLNQPFMEFTPFINDETLSLKNQGTKDIWN